MKQSLKNKIVIIAIIFCFIGIGFRENLTGLILFFIGACSIILVTIINFIEVIKFNKEKREEK